MAKSTVSYASTAYHTALASQVESNVVQHPPSSASGSSNGNATASSGFSYANMAGRSSSEGNARHSPRPSPSSMSNSHLGSTPSPGPHVGTGWMGSNAVPDPISSPSPYPHDLPLPPSRASSRASSDAPYSSSDAFSTSSPSSLHYSQSQTSHDSSAAFHAANQHLYHNAEHGLPPLLRAAAPPPLIDLGGWEEAFSLPSNKKKAPLTGDSELDGLTSQIDELGLDQNLRAKPAGFVPGGIVNINGSKPIDFAPLPPPSSTSDAWSFKKNLGIKKGSLIPPSDLRLPSNEYREISNRASSVQHPTTFKGKRPKLVVLDLNNTLVARGKATTAGARNAKQRPYLSNFLEYLCGSEIVDGQLQRRFAVMIWSSAQADNVAVMCEAISLLSNAGSQAPLLVDLWDRSSMDLTDEQFNSKFPTIKDLNKVWSKLEWTPPSPYKLSEETNITTSSTSSSSSSSSSNGTTAPAKKAWTEKDLHWSQYDTILIDDSFSKASLQPNNHLSIPAYKPHNISNISSSSPAANDTCLLQLIAMLEKLKMHSNVSAAIRSGLFNGLGKSDIGHQWAEQGVKIAREKGIKIQDTFDRAWGDRLFNAPVSKKQATANLLYEQPRAQTETQPSVVGWF